MGAPTFVFVVLFRSGRMEALLSRNVPYALSKMREHGPARLMMVEEYPTSREAMSRLKDLKGISKKALRILIADVNPNAVDLAPDFVLSDAEPGPLTVSDLFRRFGLEDWDDFDLGNGGIGARLPKGPRPLRGSSANPIPRQEPWIDHIGTPHDCAN